MNSLNRPLFGTARCSRPDQTQARRRRSAFTLIELLTVISIIGVLAAIGAGLAGVASRKAKESTMRAQRDQIIAAIESFRADFNQYPPDNVRNGLNFHPALNPLFYELTGTIASDQGKYYRSVDRELRLPSQQLLPAIGVQGFVNSVESPQRPKTYLTGLKASQRREISVTGEGAGVTVELLVIPYAWPRSAAATAPLAGRVATTAPADQRFTNPWRYVSTKPTNNVAAFDLWAEAYIGKKRTIIGNW
jgi:prepilin-type N-terminal cleavage/methylation domain-containing protein